MANLQSTIPQSSASSKSMAIARSQIPFSPSMVPCYGPNIQPTVLQHSPSIDLPPTPKTLEELLEFQWIHSSHFLMTQEENKEPSIMLQKLHGLITEKNKLHKEMKSLQRKVDFYDSTLKLVKDMVIISAQHNDDENDEKNQHPNVKISRKRARSIDSLINDDDDDSTDETEEMDLDSVATEIDSDCCSHKAVNNNKQESDTTISTITTTKTTTSATITDSRIESLNNVNQRISEDARICKEDGIMTNCKFLVIF